ncbi:MAG: NUDIX domain-containing protein [Chloroflexi bacterium]|nr:NUDIX domain-containing protein [Chloroflexota bacterium]
MLEIIEGDRVGKRAILSMICSGMVFDAEREKILITRRDDNGLWCLPGGRMEPGESVAEACAREVLEETGLEVEVGKLTGVYSTPNRVVAYNDGNSYQPVVMNFEATIIGGGLTTSDETTACGFYSLAEMADMDVMESSLERIKDAVLGSDQAFVR